MSKYSEFFLNSKSSIVQLELLEISHSQFTKVYRVVRNAVDGVVVNTESAVSVPFEYYPLKITLGEERENLDFYLKIELGDLGELVENELSNIYKNDAFAEKPSVIYRTYRSDDLTTPLYGPVRLEITTLSYNKQGLVFEAKVPSLNISKTGEIYKPDRFPMLRGFI